MIFAEYPFTPHVYVVHHTTGFGEQSGEPYRVKDVFYSSDSEEQCREAGEKAFPRDPSGWTYDNYEIRVNTCTEKGKQLEAAWNAEFDKRWAELEENQKKNPHLYKTYSMPDGTSITVKHNEALDGPLKL